jgi:hypothetical protein
LNTQRTTAAIGGGSAERFAWAESWEFRGIVFLCAVAIVISRRPDAVFHAQFWAEDGKVIYADAYQAGIRSLFWPFAKYLILYLRMVGLVAQPFGLARAPLVLNTFAIVTQALPVWLLLSRRLSWVGRIPARVFLASLYLALPNSEEVMAIFPNSQWFLALLCFLVIVSAEMKEWAWRCFDLVIVGLCALTGPFVIVLAPISAVIWWKRRGNWGLVLTMVLFIGALVQAAAIVFSHFHRTQVLGATPALFFKIVAGQIFLGALVGMNGFCLKSVVAAAAVMAVGLIPVVYSLSKGSLEIKLLIVFAAVMFGACLISPNMGLWSDVPAWQTLQLPRAGMRYWFLPMLAFVTTLVFALGGKSPQLVRMIAGFCLLLMGFGIVRDWRYPAFRDMHFAAYAEQFEAVRPGTEVVIPINPPGWSMRLVKR